MLITRILKNAFFYQLVWSFVFYTSSFSIFIALPEEGELVKLTAMAGFTYSLLSIKTLVRNTYISNKAIDNLFLFEFMVLSLFSLIGIGTYKVWLTTLYWLVQVIPQLILIFIRWSGYSMSKIKTIELSPMQTKEFIIIFLILCLFIGICVAATWRGAIPQRFYVWIVVKQILLGLFAIPCLLIIFKIYELYKSKHRNKTTS